MHTALASELAVLANQLDRIAERTGATRDFTAQRLRDALKEVVACFPVYRTYVTRAGLSARGRALHRAGRSRRPGSAGEPRTAEIFDFLREVLLAKRQAPLGIPRPRSASRASRCKFQQFTGPVMAKGVEDTAFYRYNRLVSLNEVGGDPRQFGSSVAAFHHVNDERGEAMAARHARDRHARHQARARTRAPGIDVLSEMPGAWARARGALVAPQPIAQRRGRWPPRPVAQRRVSDLPDSAGRLAGGMGRQEARAGPRARGGHEAAARLHRQGDARGEAPLELGQTPTRRYEVGVCCVCRATWSTPADRICSSTISCRFRSRWPSSAC